MRFAGVQGTVAGNEQGSGGKGQGGGKESGHGRLLKVLGLVAVDPV
jgi:hypothetical protein